MDLRMMTSLRPAGSRVTPGSATFGWCTLIDSRLGDRLPVFPDDADLLSMGLGELYRHTEQLVLVLLIIRCEGILMKDHHFFSLTTRLGEVRQQLLDCRCEGMLSVRIPGL